MVLVVYGAIQGAIVECVSFLLLFLFNFQAMIVRCFCRLSLPASVSMAVFVHVCVVANDM